MKRCYVDSSYCPHRGHREHKFIPLATRVCFIESSFMISFQEKKFPSNMTPNFTNPFGIQGVSRNVGRSSMHKTIQSYRIKWLEIKKSSIKARKPDSGITFSGKQINRNDNNSFTHMRGKIERKQTPISNSRSNTATLRETSWEFKGPWITRRIGPRLHQTSSQNKDLSHKSRF